ncbi:MAG TPA: hypothetical protein VK665_01850 [Candidatus Elarobacter sp.]|nr:hypothetical protein [Candidatus Elarobacter sp.]
MKTGTSKDLVALGLELARQDGIEPLAPGERRPVGWVNANHETGRSDVPAHARESALPDRA